MQIPVKPTDILEDVMDLHTQVGGFSGNDVNSGHLISPRLKKLLILSLIGIIMNVNGIYQCWYNTPELIGNMIILLLAIQIIIRHVVRYIIDENGLSFEIFENIRQFYRNKQNESKEISDMLLKDMKMIYLYSKVYLVGSLVFYHISILNAWINAILKWDYLLMFEAYLPFIDPKTLFGYLLAMIFQTLMNTIVYLFFMIGDISLLQFCLHVVPRSKYLMIKLSGVEKKLKERNVIKSENKSKKKQNKVPKKVKIEEKSAIKPDKVVAIQQKTELFDDIEQDLKEFLKEFQNYNEHINLARKLMSITVITSLSLNSISIALSIVYMRFASVLKGLVSAAIFTFLIINPCIFGTIVSNRKNLLLERICEFPWYELSLKNQKLYLQMVHVFQSSPEYKVKIIGVVNMELCADIIKGVYNFVMFIINFF